MDGNDSTLESLVTDALTQQEIEYASEFATLNPPLTWLIEEYSSGDLIPVCEQLLRSLDPARRVLGARIVREVKGEHERGAGLVRAGLWEETDSDVLGWMVSALRFLGGPSDIDSLLALSNHPDDRVRDQVAGALSTCASSVPVPLDARVARELSILARDRSAEVQKSAVFEIGEWWIVGSRDEDLRMALQEALASSNSDIRKIAELAIAEAASAQS